MIRIATPTESATPPAWHEPFLEMLPAIRRQAQIAFRHRDPEARQEAVQEVIAHAAVAIEALYDRGTPELAYPSVLALHGIKRVKVGRRAGTPMNVRDVSSEYCQLKKQISVKRLDRYDHETGQWCEVLVEDRRAGPADIARVRIDFSDWLKTLRRRNRRIAETLSAGETTSRVARRFHVSPSRVSQLRGEFKDSWNEFCDDVAAE